LILRPHQESRRIKKEIEPNKTHIIASTELYSFFISAIV
jgi:hypothetical protein